MKRVLRPGGTGLVIDLRRDVSTSTIVAQVYPKERFSFSDRLWGRMIFEMLRRRAYTVQEMQSLLAQAGITQAGVTSSPIGFEARFEC